MKYLVISDTHGRVDRAVEAYKKYMDFDAIIHLGDVKADAVKIERQTGAYVISVNGNMDGDFSNRNYRVLTTPYGRILLIHGHSQDVKRGLTTLLYKTEEMECKAVFFGHTHQALYREHEGITLLNPGSLTYPYDFDRPSYAVVEISDAGELNAGIVYV